jgi:hypothetical protein
MTDATERWHQTTSDGGVMVPDRMVTAEGAVQTTYRKWLDHCHGCQPCEAGTPCQTGVTLYQDYREARIS